MPIYATISNVSTKLRIFCITMRMIIKIQVTKIKNLTKKKKTIFQNT